MILSSRNKIRLSKTLHAQTTPYPRMNVWMRRAVFVLILSAVTGVYLAAKPSTDSIQRSNQELDKTKEILGEQQPPTSNQAELETYIVKKGDTLFNVSQKYDISWQTLAQINNLSEPYLLKIGQTLKIPDNK